MPELNTELGIQQGLKILTRVSEAQWGGTRISARLKGLEVFITGHTTIDGLLMDGNLDLVRTHTGHIFVRAGNLRDLAKDDPLRNELLVTETSYYIPFGEVFTKEFGWAAL